MFKRRRLRKMVGKYIEPTIVLYVYPTVETSDKIASILGADKIEKLLVRNFGKIAQDPVILKALNKILKTRSRKLVDDLIDLLEEQVRKVDWRNENV